MKSVPTLLAPVGAMNRPVLLAAVASLVLLACWPATNLTRAADELALTDLIEQVEPAVVRIDVQTDRGDAVGSGFVVDPKGIIVTNHHVMAGANAGEVTFANKKTANILGTLYLDAKRDIAVAQIEGDSYPALPLATELPRKGTGVAAFGAPLGLSFSATEGVVSAVRKADELKDYIDNRAGTWVQTSAPISPGNSGGPLVNYHGEVVGANTLTFVAMQNLNFAISSIDIADAVKHGRGRSVVKLADGAAKESIEVPLSALTGARRLRVISQLADLMLIADVNSRDASIAAKALLLIEPDSIDDKEIISKVAKGYKRIAFERHFHNEDGIRGMARWGGKYSVPYLIELMDMERFHSNEVLIDVLSNSGDPRAAVAIARRLGNFFDRQRAYAALRRMGPAAEPGLIEAVHSPDPSVCLAAIGLLAEQGTPASLTVLNAATRKGTPVVRRAARTAMGRIRVRQRDAEKAAAGDQ